MAFKRSADAHWAGSGKEGAGALSTESGVLSNNQYSFNTRFADGIGTNPEELLAAAHAGCFTMKLSFVLQAAGLIADSIDTKATVLLDPKAGAITDVYLVTRVKAAGLDADKLVEYTNDAKQNCPVSKLFNANIHLDAALA
jgi:lipoyl-dependent peroxiredoxin